MNRQQLIEQLYDAHNSFIDYIESLPAEEYIFSFNNKWTAAQQLDHIVRCVKPLTLLYGLPKIIIRLRFGKANRKSKTFDQFVTKYEEQFSKGTNPHKQFIPEISGLEKRTELVNALTTSINKLCRQLSGFSEDQLDRLIIPHPMFGKLTLREMIYFTIHHVQHHEEITKRNLRREEVKARTVL